jgi:hypothetical protein
MKEKISWVFILSEESHQYLLNTLSLKSLTVLWLFIQFPPK